MRKWVLGTGAGLLAATAVMALAQAQSPAAPAQPGPRADRARAMFDRIDTNRDGYVTKAEAEAAQAQMRARMEQARKERRDRAFARLDANKDGTISRAEFDAAPRMAMGPDGRGDRKGRRGRMAGNRMADGAMSGRWFDRLDADKDGRVSFAEAQAVRQRSAMRGPGMRNPHGMLPPGHPPVPGMTPAPMGGVSPGDRPLGGGRNI